MKRILSFILSAVMVLSVFVAFPIANEVAAAPTTVSGLINNSHAQLNIKTPIANVQKVSDYSAGLTGSALFKVADLENVEATLSNCLANAILPTFTVETAEEADKLISAMSATGCTDANVITSYPAIAGYIRKQSSDIRTGIILSDVLEYGKTSLTAKEANDIRTMVRSAPATFCVIDSDNADYQLIKSLRALSVAVWVNVSAKAGTNLFNIQVVNAVAAGANGVISEDSAAVNTLINKHFLANTLAHTPLIIGHKGNDGIVVGNSMESFESAIANGADAIELDVVFTKDKKAIVAHGPNISDDTNATVATAYSNLTFEQTQQYYLKNKTQTSTSKIQLFSTVLKKFKGRNIIIFLEFKAGGAEEVKYTMELIKAEQMEDQIVVISFDGAQLLAAQENLNGMSTAYLSSFNGIELCKNESDALSLLSQYIAKAQKFNSVVSPSYGAIGPSGNYFSQALVDRGMTSWPWTSALANNRTPVELGFLCGCDGVTTDDAQWSKNMISNMTASDIKLDVNGTVSNTVASVFTYGGKETKLSLSDVVYTVVSGDKYIEIKNGKITGKQDGVATVMFGYKTKTTTGGEYVVYAQPIEISVGNGKAEKIDHIAVGKDAVDASGKIPLGYETPSAAKFQFGYVLTDGIAEGSVNPTDRTWFTFMSDWNATSSKTGSVTIDLGASYKLSEIKLHLANSNQTFGNGTISAVEPEYVKVKVSQDCKEFPKSYDIATKSDANVVYWSGVEANDTARYIKVEVKVGADGRYALIDEIAVFGTATDTPDAPIIPDIPEVPEFEKVEHIAIDKDAVDASGKVPLGYETASAAGFRFGYTLTDGKAQNELDPTNFTWFAFMDAWNATSSKTGSVTIDLGGFYDLTEIKLHLANFNGPAGKGTLSAVPPEHVKVMISKDGNDFTSFDISVNTAAEVIYWSGVKLDATARYIKVEIKVGSAGRYALIDEIAVYGTANTDPTYTVSFDGHNGTGTMADIENIFAGEEITLPECGFTAPEGMQFKAWNVNGTEMAAGKTVKITSNLSVFAVWEEIPVTTIQRLLGDVNNDGSVDKKDYAALKRYCFDTMQLDDAQMLVADVNQDENVDKKDYAVLKRACFGTMVIDPQYIQVPVQ